MRRWYKVLSGAATLAVIAAGTVLLAPGASAADATLHVDATNGHDTGNCVAASCKTIEYAVGQAADGDTISIAAGSYSAAAPAGSLAISKSVTLEGSGSSGAGATVIEAPVYGIAMFPDPDNIRPLSVTVKNLKIAGAGADTTRGGISFIYGSLDLDDVVVTGTDTGMQVGSPLGATTVHVRDSTFTGNTVSIRAQGQADHDLDLSVADSTVTDGAIQARDVPSLKITGTTITGAKNFALDLQSSGDGTVNTTLSDSTIKQAQGSGIYAQGNQEIAIERSTIAGTTPGGNGGGTGVVAFQGAAVHLTQSAITGNAGPGMFDLAGTVTVSESTVSDNTGAAIIFGGQDGGPAPLTVTDSTLVQTTPAKSSLGFLNGVLVGATLSDGPNQTAKVSGSIVAGGGADAPACSKAIIVGTHNLATDDTCALSAKANLAKTDPKLGTLGIHVGATATQLPADHSPAVDAIPLGRAGCAAGATDQRGVSRPQPGPDGKCDIGAVELKQAPLAISPKTLPHATVGKAYHVQLHASGGLDSDYTFGLLKGSLLPAVLTLSRDGLISGTPRTAGTFTFTVVVGDPVTRTYQLVVDPVAATTTPSSSGSGSSAGSGSPILADTGAPVAPQLWWAVLLLGAGLIALAAGSLRRRATGRH